jgi:hypothetical protein
MLRRPAPSVLVAIALCRIHRIASCSVSAAFSGRRLRDGCHAIECDLIQMRAARGVFLPIGWLEEGDQKEPLSATRSPHHT